MEVYFKRQSIAENCGRMMVGEWLGKEVRVCCLLSYNNSEEWQEQTDTAGKFYLLSGQGQEKNDSRDG